MRGIYGINNHVLLMPRKWLPRNRRSNEYRFMNIDNFDTVAASVGGGFFAGILLGYALKKVIKMLAVVFGLFLAGLTFLQYQQIASINWNKIEGAIMMIANTTSSTINDNNNVAALAMMSNFGIPLTSSMSIGFTIGFMKG
jgi:uncharacterized membrane protein (Fun14 family)